MRRWFNRRRGGRIRREGVQTILATPRTGRPLGPSPGRGNGRRRNEGNKALCALYRTSALCWARNGPRQDKSPASRKTVRLRVILHPDYPPPGRHPQYWSTRGMSSRTGFLSRSPLAGGRDGNWEARNLSWAPGVERLLLPRRAHPRFDNSRQLPKHPRHGFRYGLCILPGVVRFRPIPTLFVEEG
jgi:hypothetical protein